MKNKLIIKTVNFRTIMNNALATYYKKAISENIKRALKAKAKRMKKLSTSPVNKSKVL